MPGRFTRPVLAFSALALLAALAPAEGSADDAQAEPAAQAYARGAGHARQEVGEGRAAPPGSKSGREGRTDARAYLRGESRGDGAAAGDARAGDTARAHPADESAGRRADGREPSRRDGEVVAGPASAGLAPPTPELRDNPLFGTGDRSPSSSGRSSGPASGPGEEDAVDAKGRAGDGRAGADAPRGAGPRDPAGGTGEAERHRAAPPGKHRVAGKRAAAPALALSAAVGRAARTQAQATADALTAHAERIEQRVAAYRKWGLEPLPARPAPPVLKPRVRGAKVLRSVPTDDRVVFLTIDDGAMKSPEFLEMIADLDIPVTSFLADEEAVLGPGYDYFRRLEDLGGTTQNHTLHHPYLPALSRKEQRREICGQQDVLQEELGGPQPRLFRPPYGAYDHDTLRAARDCGLDAVVLWGMEAWADRIDFQEPGHGLYPGAIILTHYRGPASWGDGGTMVDMLRRVLTLAAEQGYAVARLEDYI